jgi:hypothetical protein
MGSFKKDIKIDEGFTAWFLFTRIYTVSGVIYFVIGVDRSRTAFKFSMKLVEGLWKIIVDKPVHNWILKIENQLSDIILNE